MNVTAWSVPGLVDQTGAALQVRATTSIQQLPTVAEFLRVHTFDSFC